MKDVEERIFLTENELEISGEIGYLEVPENRQNPQSRTIRIKYVRLKSLSDNPVDPVIYLEGGGSPSTWIAEDPEELTYWVELLEVSDLIFIDQRGTTDESLIYVWDGPFPSEFFVTEEASNDHYAKMVEASLVDFKNRGIDVNGYSIEEHANDVNDLAYALNLDQFIIYGFSYGTHIGMTVMKLFPGRVSKAILAGADAPNQAFNYPRYLDDHIEMLAGMVALDKNLSKSIPDFTQLVNRVMTKLEDNPATVNVTNPISGEEMPLSIGAFGLALILRLDIDDYSDIPIIPRLLHTIDQGDYSMLKWFAQKRIVFSLAIPGNGINQQLASGAGETRWQTITKEAEESIFGNVVNFPFSAAKDYWPTDKLSFDSSIPLKSDIPTLFLSGDLDCRTPVDQVEETMKGFSQAIHVVIGNAGHEQVLWDKETRFGTIPEFLKGVNPETEEAYYSDIKFIGLGKKAKGHPSLN